MRLKISVKRILVDLLEDLNIQKTKYNKLPKDKKSVSNIKITDKLIDVISTYLNMFDTYD